MAISIGLIFSSQKRGPLNNFEWSWLGLCQHQTMINGRRTSQTWNCHRVTNKRTHTHTQNYPWPWFLDEVEDITNREGRFNGPIYRLNDLNVVIICIRCFQCLMIIIIILFKAIVLHFLMRDIGYQTLFSKSSTNQNPPLMMDCPALPRFKFTAPGEKATHFTPQWWPCCFSTWAVWFFFWKWDFRSKE